MFTLDNFYTSKEWVSLMAVIKTERLNDKGELICTHCEQPIVKAYDCIGHHITELTEDNVNDYNISLNPDNVRLVHHRCHNIIHNKLGYSNRTVYVVYGSPLAGKSTFVKDNSQEGDLIIDIESIWQCISGCDRYVKPNRLKSNVFDIRNNLIEAIKFGRGKWLNAWIIGGYPLKNERERLCRSFHKLTVKEIFIDTPQEECLQRLHDDPKGRDVEEWTGYINEWWEKYRMNF